MPWPRSRRSGAVGSRSWAPLRPPSRRLSGCSRSPRSSSATCAPTVMSPERRSRPAGGRRRLRPAHRGSEAAPGPPVAIRLARLLPRACRSRHPPTSYVHAGRSVRFPVASTRSDLDLIARAGARLWQVLGLSAADVVVSALPSGPFASQQAFSLAALVWADSGQGRCSPSAMIRPWSSTPLAVVTAMSRSCRRRAAPEFVFGLADAGASLASITTVLIAGAPGRRSAMTSTMLSTRSPTSRL